jgi:hypothetical protein
LDKYTLLIFTGFIFIFFLLTFFFLPETKAKTVDTIYAELNAGPVWRKHHLNDNRIKPDDDGSSHIQRKHTNDNINSS